MPRQQPIFCSECGEHRFCCWGLGKQDANLTFCLDCFIEEYGYTVAARVFEEELEWYATGKPKAGCVYCICDGGAEPQKDVGGVAGVGGYTVGAQHPVRFALPPDGTGVQAAPGGSSYPYRRDGAEHPAQ